MRKPIIALIAFLLIFPLFSTQKVFAETFPLRQMNLATLYWVYYGIPIPQTTVIDPGVNLIEPVTHPPVLPTPTLTVIPTIVKITTVQSILNPTVTPTLTVTTPPPSTSTDSREDMLIQGINNYRSSQGLGPVKNDPDTCSFAQTRANEIINGFNHDGFTNRVSSKTLPYPSYHQVTENIAETSDPNQVVPLWVNSPGHAENMRQDTPYVCVKWNGNYYAYEGWRP